MESLFYIISAIGWIYVGVLIMLIWSTIKDNNLL
jgi:hypothetical protein